MKILYLAITALAMAYRIGPATAQIRPRDTLPVSFNRGTVVGNVLDDRSSEPLLHMIVFLDNYPIASTDTSGSYVVALDRFMEPGWHQVHVGRPGYIEERRSAWMERGTVDTVDLRLRRAPRPCCRLNGHWNVRLHLEEAGALGPVPSERVVSGTISFADTFPPVWPERTPTDSFVTSEVGRYGIDLRPFFGTQIAKDVSSTMFGSTKGSFPIEATGSVYSHDSVTIDLIPRISHGGLSFSGRVQGDSISGTWVQRAYCCGARGTFVMHRAR